MPDEDDVDDYDEELGDFRRPDEWLDTDNPYLTDEEVERDIKLLELRRQGFLINPTVIRFPSSEAIIGHIDVVIPGSVSDYLVVNEGGQWRVIARPTDEKIYDGPGPVEVFTQKTVVR